MLRTEEGNRGGRVHRQHSRRVCLMARHGRMSPHASSIEVENESTAPPPFLPKLRLAQVGELLTEPMMRQTPKGSRRISAVHGTRRELGPAASGAIQERRLEIISSASLRMLTHSEI